MTHICAQAGCDDPATHLVIESHPLAMLFRSGAGLVCHRHADGLENVGGIAIDIADFAAWQKERR